MTHNILVDGGGPWPSPKSDARELVMSNKRLVVVITLMVVFTLVIGLSLIDNREPDLGLSIDKNSPNNSIAVNDDQKGEKIIRNEDIENRDPSNLGNEVDSESTTTGESDSGDGKVVDSTGRDELNNENKHVRPLPPWDDSNIPKTIAPLEVHTYKGKQRKFLDSKYTPVFVDESTLKNVFSDDRILMKTRGKIHEHPRNDGSLEIKVDASGYEGVAVRKLQVACTSSGELWEYQWRDKKDLIANMFVPYAYGDLLHVRAHLSSGEILESYISSMGLGVDTSSRQFSNSIVTNNSVHVPLERYSTSGGTFDVNTNEGVAVEHAVLLDSCLQVLGRTNKQGRIVWTKTLASVDNPRTPIDETKTSHVRYPVVLWKPGYVPVSFSSSIPVSGSVELGVEVAVVRAELSGVANLLPCEKSLSTGYKHGQSDLIPLPNDAVVPKPEDLPALLGYGKQNGTSAYRLDFPSWRDNYFLKIPDLEIGGYSGRSFEVLANWFYQRWSINPAGILEVELPVNGKYLLAIGSMEYLPRDDEQFEQFSHVVYIDATNLEKPVFTLVSRP